MATDFTQDTVLHFLQSSGGSVKNSDLLLHFRSFIRDHADRDRNRELFKKFVNSVATVQQLDGVSHVVLRKKFKGHVPGGGERSSSGPLRVPGGRNTEPPPENAKRSAAGRAEKPRQKVTTPAPPGGTAGKAVLPAAGIITNNNNNNVETNLNLKHKQQQGKSSSEVSVRPALSQISAKTELKTPSLSQPPAQEQLTKAGQLRMNAAPPPEITPVVPVVRHQTFPQAPKVQTPSLPQPPAQEQLTKVGHLRVSAGPSKGIRAVAPAVSHQSGTFQQAPQVKTPRLSEPLAQEQLTKVGQARPGTAPPPVINPVVSAQTFQQAPVPEPLRGRQPEGHHEPLQAQIAPRRMRYRQSYKSAVSYDEDEEEEEDEEVSMRPVSAGGAWPVGAPLGELRRDFSASSPCIIDQPAPPSVASSSSSERKLPKIYIQDVKGEMLQPGGPDWSLKSGLGQRGHYAGPGPEPGSVPLEAMSTRRSLPSETERYTPSPELGSHHDVFMDRRYSQPASVLLEPWNQRLGQSQRAWLSSSHSSIFSPSSDAGAPSSDWPSPGSPRRSMRNSSYEDLQAGTGKTGERLEIQEALQRAQRTNFENVAPLANSKTSAPWHHSSDHLYDDQEHTAGVLPRHVSTGDLYDDREDAESSEGSASSPALRQSPAVARRLSSQLRSRMCRSLGADLDQLLQEEARGGAGGSEAARLNRLHMISSSLSLRYNLSSSSLSSCSTPPRCHSMADLMEGVEGRGGRKSPLAIPSSSSSSTAPREGPSRQSLVPLESREHAWLVKGAAGAWPDIYSLFREDSSLLNRRDFISGFTVLHWIAKHGDHRVLNTLWYGVQKSGLTFDINARSTCGHTPLHIAAIHSHKSIMRLLVGKFGADVKLRDTAGKKPWQYLDRTMPLDIFQLLGAPSRVALRGEGGAGRVDSSWRPEQQQPRRRRRHHFSTASGERPLTIAGTTRVKRSSSIAAFLKHKSLRRFQGHQSDSSL